MIRVAGTLTCAGQPDVAILQRHLPEHIALSREEPGCLKFVVDPTDNPLVFRLDETFIDRAAFEAHQTRTRASAWFRATATLKRDFQITED